MPIHEAMNARTRVLRDLVRDAHYVVDPDAVAEAILVRSAALRILPDITLRQAQPPDVPQMRSFRPHRGARSFRLSRGDRRHGGGDEPDPSHPLRLSRPQPG
ncbi:MAG TPA: hypothetical protein VMY78_18270 [Solirubrobacteraceae bacterium]|nr:hypothetical protein [Solirubrobacteraceae bacterium]